MHFSEILLILVVALLVIKPEKLPEAARALAGFIRWVRQTTQKIKQEIEKTYE